MKKQQTMYANDFQFFLREQIAIAETGNREEIRFFSRLDGTLFRQLNGRTDLGEDEAITICKEIHKSLITNR